MRIVSASFFVLAACGSVTRPFPVKEDAGLPDSAIDTPPQLPPTPSRELVGGAGRVKSATYTFDVEAGHPVSQQPATSITYKLEGNAAVKP